ncbi:hypothetical protein FVQ98_19315 [Ottowia sp. GY511]|uniref:Recombinase A n=1 Tax=Ottowia flava TaxID=2675430 RepID=A0ABW4KX21_9BURK|nr:hypothetical protein [Ottowia sp. GY511]TXK21372.1 hypothetical protein FVQ98_19315 [Ottowia sp. GY511]
MPGREGVVRRYVLGLGMLTVPSYRSAGAFSHPKPLPGVLVRATALPHRTGSTALAQAVALLSGQRVGVPPVVTAVGMLGQIKRWLPEAAVSLVGEQEPADLLALCTGVVDAGGVMLLQWQPWPRTKYGNAHAPDPPSHWMLVVGVEGSWHAKGLQVDCQASALLVLDATVPPVWGCGHNLHLVPGEHKDHPRTREAAMSRAVWTARTLEGGLEYGIVLAAVFVGSGQTQSQ